MHMQKRMQVIVSMAEHVQAGIQKLDEDEPKA
jgi:hypothetical protein